MKIQRALVSVFDKTGIVEFAKELSAMGIEIVSSGGTSRELAKSGIKVTDVASVTGFPEMMDGRVKTLHPKIHGAILADRSKKSHLDEAKKAGVELIDLVVVNLYPFEQVTANEKVELGEAIENIDIGGPTLVRSAAKNYSSVGVVVNPKRYESVIAELKKEKCSLSEQTRKSLALEAFEHVAHYDVVIEQYLRKEFGIGGSNLKYPDYLNLSFKKIQNMRYGENSHQTAAFYIDNHKRDPCVSSGKCLQGKEISFNNILDINSAFELVKEFAEPTTVIVKHNNPCGVATDSKLVESYKKALAVDSEAAFGGVIAFNREVTDADFAKLICERFYEVIVAPHFSDSARAVFSTKKNLRLIEMGALKLPIKRETFADYRSVVGGFLVQDADTELLDKKNLKVVTKRKPTEQELKDLLYAWTVSKYVRSNAIIYARDNRAVGIGAGQMKRVDAAKLAAMIAESYGDTVKGCAMASDAFFPFRDGIDEAAKRGVTCVIQPGGSIKDQEVIAAADEHGMAMVFTGIRHFRH
ncbi:TPA: bifunctional phosphoribosylaminoimidazolecarboxamide formyltransferase/IMP cyclohydrolase [Candidatus Micrarchaeota archaeon]|nr:bifunctional phosphoribosylaminoimidazolecarboxamide formyltransferase/IMP cyclohydrolase [Candidatus Micrarchaeota archaeon]